MKLFINTSSRETILLKLDSTSFESHVVGRKSQTLVPFILESLQKSHKNLHDITEIEVMTGPGSFTGLRVGASVAQSLGWALSVPVNGDRFNQRKYVEIRY